MKHFVLIQEPRRKGVYIKCADLDQCLKVVERESKTTLSGTRLTLIRKSTRQHGEPLAMWRVGRGSVRRYWINAGGNWEAMGT